MSVKIAFTGALSDRRTAVQRSGQLEGGGAVTFDVPETETDKLAALMALARVPLRITVEVDTEAATAPNTETPGEIPDAGKPRWARRG